MIFVEIKILYLKIYKIGVLSQDKKTALSAFFQWICVKTKINHGCGTAATKCLSESKN